MSNKTIAFQNANLRDPAGAIVPVVAVDNGDGTYSLGLATASGGSGVTVTGAVTISAGSNYIGQTGGTSTDVTIVPVIAAGSYVSGDYVGASGSPIEVPLAARVNGGSFFVTAAILIDNGKQSVAGELWLFDTAVTPPADSAAWSISDADAAHCIGIIPFSTYYASALNSISQIDGGRFGFRCAAGTRSIWACFVTRGAPGYVAGDLAIRLLLSQDV